MVQNEHRQFRPTSPASDRAGNAWDTWVASDHSVGLTTRSPRDTRLIASIDWLDRDLGSTGIEGSHR